MIPTFRHVDLIARDPMTVARLRASLERGDMLEIVIDHEDDDACCRREPFAVSLTAALCGKPAPVEARQ
jgi:hypothetical protein